MLASLSASAATDATNSNIRLAEMIKLWTGEITLVSQLTDAAWNKGLCVINASVPGNWTRPYCTADFAALGASTAWHIHLKKQSVGAPSTKNITFRIARAAGVVNIYAGLFNDDGSSSNVTTLLQMTPNIAATGTRFIIGSGVSGLFCLVVGGILSFGVERTVYPYDTNSAENLGIIGTHIGTTSTLYVSNIYNPKNQNYTAFTPTNAIAVGTVASTRDASGNVALPFIPMYTEYYENGWAGGNLSTNLGVYRTADSFGNTWDTVTQNGQTYRILQAGTGVFRFVALDA